LFSRERLKTSRSFTVSTADGRNLRSGCFHCFPLKSELKCRLLDSSSTCRHLQYADPVLDQLDVHQVVRHRLFRESCYNHKGNYVKDLSQLGRPIGQTIIIDNSPASYIFHPKNALPVSSWFNDVHGMSFLLPCKLQC
jgi:hypothetical protein